MKNTVRRDAVDPSVLELLTSADVTAEEIVSSLDDVVEDWHAGRIDHEVKHNAIVNIWKIAETVGVADAAKAIICR